MPTVATMQRWRRTLDYALLHGIRITLEFNTPPLSPEQELSLEAVLLANERIKREIEKEQLGSL